MVDICLGPKGKRVAASRLAKPYYRDEGDGTYNLFGGKRDEEDFSGTLIAGKSILTTG